MVLPCACGFGNFWTFLSWSRDYHAGGLPGRCVRPCIHKSGRLGAWRPTSRRWLGVADDRYEHQYRT